MTAIEELLQRAKTDAPELYKRAVLEHYVATHGAHYDEETAKEAVSKMHSVDDGDRDRTGEHWTFDQVMEAIKPFAARMGDDDTSWDAYVAANMWWHDLGVNYENRPGDADRYIIEDAITWAFMDDDAKDGKLWHYLHAIC